MENIHQWDITVAASAFSGSSAPPLMRGDALGLRPSTISGGGLPMSSTALFHFAFAARASSRVWSSTTGCGAGRRNNHHDAPVITFLCTCYFAGWPENCQRVNWWVGAIPSNSFVRGAVTDTGGIPYRLLEFVNKRSSQRERAHHFA